MHVYSTQGGLNLFHFNLDLFYLFSNQKKFSTSLSFPITITPCDLHQSYRTTGRLEQNLPTFCSMPQHFPNFARFVISGNIRFGLIDRNSRFLDDFTDKTQPIQETSVSWMNLTSQRQSKQSGSTRKTRQAIW